MNTPTERLKYLRGEIEAERISYSELAELQDLAEHIEPGDVLLLEGAGVPEPTHHNKPMPLALQLTATAQQDSDLEDALEEVLRLVREGYTSGQGSNETGQFSFTVN